MRNLSIYQKALETQKVLKGLVKVVEFDEVLKTHVLTLDLGGVKGVILREDVDAEVDWKSLVGFVGREVYFVVKEIREDGTVFCSRKDAQILLKDVVVSRLSEGEPASAQIINILKYGAYVEVEGVTGLLKNEDFAEDYTSIGEVYKAGKKLNVRLKRITSKGHLLFEAVEKHRNPTIMNFDMFNRDQVVLGVVRGVKSDRAYVNIAPGLDALCPLPQTGEIEEGSRVSFRITQVRPEEKRVRGKIVRILN